MRPVTGFAVLAGTAAALVLLAPPAAADPIKHPWEALYGVVEEIAGSRPGDVYCFWARDLNTGNPTSLVCVPAPDRPDVPDIPGDD